VHSLGLILCAVLVLATRERPGRRAWLATATVLFFGYFALHGRTLELWMLLKAWTGLAGDPASALVDGLYAVVQFAGWPPLLIWAALMGFDYQSSPPGPPIAPMSEREPSASSTSGSPASIRSDPDESVRSQLPEVGST
jgi:hypothetical protein